MFEQKEYFYALPVAHKINGINNIIGTATCITPGIFMTARHVTEEWNRDASLDFNLVAEAEVGANYHVQALHIFNPEKDPIVWHMSKVHMDIASDLAILIGDRISGEGADIILSGKLKPILDLHMPSIGDPIISAGYAKTKNKRLGDKTFHRLRMHRYEGVVTDISPNGYTLVKNVCFQTNSTLIQGMSGGPCFNAKGELIGINNSSYEATDEHPEPITSITPIAVMFSQKINVMLQGHENSRTTTLFDLCRMGYIDAKGLCHYEVTSERWKYDTNIKCKDCK